MASIILHYNKNTQFIEILNKNNINEIIKYYDENKYSINLNQNLFDNCLKLNSLEICKFIYNKSNSKNLNFKYSLINISIIGDLDKFKWILSLDENINFNLIECINNSIFSNHTELFEYLMNLADEIHLKSLNIIRLLKKICKNGNERMFNLFHKKFPLINFSDENHIYFFNSTLSNNVTFINKIYGYSIDLNIIENGFLLLEENINKGNYNSFCWLIEKNDMILYFKIKQNYFFEISCFSNNLKLTKKIYSLINDKSNIDYLKILNKLSYHSSNECIYYLENISGINLLNSSFSIIKNTITNNNFELMDYIMKNYLKINENLREEYEILINIKLYNVFLNLNEDQLINFINFHRNNKINIDICENNLYYIIENCSIKIIKIIFKYYKNIIKFENDLLLKYTIKSKCLKKIKFIHNKILKKKY